MFCVSPEVSEYCKTRTVRPEGLTTTLSPPALFRPPGMQDSDQEEEDVEDVKPDLAPTTSLVSAPPTFPTSYPNMLRLIHPHMYRHYHPYLHIHNLHPYFNNLYSQK